MSYQSTKVLELGSCAFRQWRADSHCKFIHGYRLISKFWFGCSHLDDKNWVVDFGGLKGLKEVLEKQFDHTLCIAADDPLLNDFKSLAARGGCDLRIMPEGVGIERTAEWCFKHADAFIRKQTSDRCWVEKVEVWEHEKNSAIVSCSAVSNRVQSAVSEQSSIASVVAAPAPEIQTTQSTTVQPQIETVRPANVGNITSTGWSDVFKGTTWGA